MKHTQIPFIKLPVMKKMEAASSVQQKDKMADRTPWLLLFKRCQWITQLLFIKMIHWIAICPVDSAIQLLNNQAQKFLHVPFLLQ